MSDVKDRIKTLYETTELTQQQIADTVGVSWKVVFTVIKKGYSSAYRKQRKATSYRNSKLGDKNPMYGKIGSDHPGYIGAVSDNKGYLMVLKPSWYTGRKKSKHVFQHHVVVCEALGITEIPKGYHVHHINGDRCDNSYANLLMLTAGDHMRLHARQRRAETIQ